MLSVVPNIYEKFGKENVQPGDMYIANDPYHGGGNHLPDIVIAAPAFVGDKLVGWIIQISAVRYLVLHPEMQIAYSRKVSEFR